MPVKVRKGDYDVYAYQRIIIKLNDLIASHPNLSFGEIAEQISAWSRQPFYREYFGRLRGFTLNDAHVNTVVSWIVAHHDADFREKLTPYAIFSEIGETSRDFYYHLHQREDYDAWEQDVLQAFAGIYICAPAEDRNTFLPMSVVRRFFDDPNSVAEHRHTKRTLDVKQYITERSILILHATPNGYYHAAEYPMGLLVPPEFVTLDFKMVYEGIAIASGNSIRVFLRECLSRVSKSHSILIHAKGRVEAANPYNISINVAGHVRDEVRSDWLTLDKEDQGHLRKEFAETIAMEHHLAGNTQTELSPLPDVRNQVHMTFSRNCVYHSKPADFLRHPDVHFIRPDIRNEVQVTRLVNSPLMVGAIL